MKIYLVSKLYIYVVNDTLNLLFPHLKKNGQNNWERGGGPQNPELNGVYDSFFLNCNQL